MFRPQAGRGTRWCSWLRLQAGRSWVRFPMVSLEFFVDIFLLAVLWPRGLTQPLTEMSTRNISWGCKGSRCVGKTTWLPYCANCLEILESQPPGSLRACKGFTFYQQMLHYIQKSKDLNYSMAGAWNIFLNVVFQELFSASYNTCSIFYHVPEHGSYCRVAQEACIHPEFWVCAFPAVMLFDTWVLQF